MFQTHFIPEDESLWPDLIRRHLLQYRYFCGCALVISPTARPIYCQGDLESMNRESSAILLNLFRYNHNVAFDKKVLNMTLRVAGQQFRPVVKTSDLVHCRVIESTGSNTLLSGDTSAAGLLVLPIRPGLLVLTYLQGTVPQTAIAVATKFCNDILK